MPEMALGEAPVRVAEAHLPVTHALSAACLAAHWFSSDATPAHQRIRSPMSAGSASGSGITAGAVRLAGGVTAGNYLAK